MYKNIVCLMGIALFSCQHSSSNVSPDVFTTQSGKEVKIECYRHASLCITYDKHIIQIDPVTDKAHGITYDHKKKADVILITHEHYDHFDINAIRQLSTKETEIILNPDSRTKLGEGVAMKNGDTLTLKCGIRIEAVPAYNTTPGHTQYHPKSRDNGYVLTIENLRIYIAGDTEVIPEMKRLKNIDIAFLPCNQPYTMTTDQLVEAAKIIRPHILYPYHSGETDLNGIATELKGTGIKVRLRDME